MTETRFDPLERFSEIERLVSRIYYRFSHLFIYRTDLRDFWWQMAQDEEQHSSILQACKAIIENYDDEKLDPSITEAKANQLCNRLQDYLDQGTPAITVEEAFKIALEIEGSEIDAIYSKLLQLGGPKIAQTMENLGVPASVQRQKLKSALRKFVSDPDLIQAAERL